MADRGPALRLGDMIEAIVLVRAELADVPLPAFAMDRRRQWIVDIFSSNHRR